MFGLDALGENATHWRGFRRQKQTALALEDEVQVFVLRSLLENPEASRVFLLLKVNLGFLENLEAQAFTVSQMRHEAHQKVNLLDRDCQLRLSDDVLVDVSVNLDDLGLFLLAGGEILSLHAALAKPEKGVRVDVVRELSLSRLHHSQVQLATQQEVEVVRFVSFLVKGLPEGKFAHLTVDEELCQRD